MGNSASVRLTFNAEWFFSVHFFPVLFWGLALSSESFQKDSRKSFLLFPSWKKHFLSKETFKLLANSQGYRGIFCNELPSASRLAAALTLRTAGFLGRGENEMVQLMEALTEPRWVNYPDVLSSQAELSSGERCQGSDYPPWQQTAAKSRDEGEELPLSPVWECGNFGLFSVAGAIGAVLFSDLVINIWRRHAKCIHFHTVPFQMFVRQRRNCRSFADTRIWHRCRRPLAFTSDTKLGALRQIHAKRLMGSLTKWGV